MAKKITRAVVIGIGGTGQQVIMGIKKKFYKRYDVIPDSIQFISIDTDKSIEAIDNFSYTYELKKKSVKIDIGSEDFLYLQGGDLRSSFDYNSNVKKIAPDNLPEIAQGLISGAGANGKRIVGRLISFLNKEPIENIIGNKIEYLVSKIGEINSKLESHGFEKINLNDDQDIMVFLVCSWSGGTGSGMLWDVLGCLGKLKEEDGKNIKRFGFFFMPDFYEDYSHADNANANSYGTLLELDHIYDPKVRLEKELNFNIGGVEFKEKPLEVINLIQKNCGRFSLQNANEAYDAVATAIANLSTSVGQKAISSLVNDTQLNYLMDTKYRNYSSLGVAEISMDRSRILEYGIGKLLIPQLDNYLTPTNKDEIRSLAYKYIEDNKLNEGENSEESGNRNDLIDSLIEPDNTNDLADFQDIELKGKIGYALEDSANTYVSELSTAIDKRLTNYNVESLKSSIRDEIKTQLLDNSGGIPKSKVFAESLKSSFKLMIGFLRDEIKKHISVRQTLEEEASDLFTQIEGMNVGMLNRKKAKNLVNTIKTIYDDFGEDSIRWQIIEKKRKEKAVEIYLELIELLNAEFSQIEKISKAVETSTSVINADNQNYDPKLSIGRVINLGYFMKTMIDQDPYLILKNKKSEKTPKLDLNIAKIFNSEAQLDDIHKRLLDILMDKLDEIASDNSLAKSLLDITCPIDNIIKNFLTKNQQNKMWISLNNIFDVFWSYDGMDIPYDTKKTDKVSKSTDQIFIVGTHEGKEETSYINSKNIANLSLANNFNSKNLNIVATNDTNSITLFIHESAIPAKNLTSTKKFKKEYLRRVSSDTNYFFSDKRFEGKVADIFESRGASMEQIRESWTKGCVLGAIFNKARGYHIEYDGVSDLFNPGQSREKNDRTKAFEFFASKKEYVSEMNEIFKAEETKSRDNICKMLVDYFNNKIYTVKNIGKQKSSLSEAETDLLKREKRIVIALGIYTYGMRKSDFYNEKKSNKREVDALERAIERAS